MHVKVSLTSQKCLTLFHSRDIATQWTHNVLYLISNLNSTFPLHSGEQKTILQKFTKSGLCSNQSKFKENQHSKSLKCFIVSFCNFPRLKTDKGKYIHQGIISLVGVLNNKLQNRV